MDQVLLVPNETTFTPGNSIPVLDACEESSVTIARREVETKLDLLWHRPSPLTARPCLIGISVYTTCK